MAQGTRGGAHGRARAGSRRIAGHKGAGQTAATRGRAMTDAGRGAVQRRVLMGALAALLVLGGCGGRVSGAIGQGCLNSGRPAATPALCSCVQQVANQTLTSAEQRRAAQFFREPQRAQDTRQSDRPGDEAFWRRYRAFADRAAAVCQ
jgi:hypothetical protein